MNTVNLIGNLTKDPDVRYSTSQTAIARFSIAINRPKDKNGNEQTDYPSCIAFGKTAEIIEKYCRKGNKIGITGRIQTGSYQAQDGHTVYTTDVVVERLDLLTPKSDSNQNQPGSYPQGQAGYLPQYPPQGYGYPPQGYPQGAYSGYPPQQQMSMFPQAGAQAGYPQPPQGYQQPMAQPPQAAPQAMPQGATQQQASPQPGPDQAFTNPPDDNPYEGFAQLNDDDIPF